MLPASMGADGSWITELPYTVEERLQNDMFYVERDMKVNSK